jgi:hypothetical protein
MRKIPARLLEKLNARGVGQFHVFEDGQFHSTWHSHNMALATAMADGGRTLFNDSGDRLPVVHDKKGSQK